MYPKILAEGRLYYREIGEAPKLRRTNAIAKAGRARNHLDVACEYLSSLMQRPELIANYESRYYTRAR